MAQRLHSEEGFTIVEVIVAMVVLLIGILGVLSLLSGALVATAANNERVGATNLARELVEASRGLAYEDLTSALVVTRLQARAGLGSGSPWTIERRGVTYTVTTTTCAYDDPADGYGVSAPANACTANAAGGDGNGDDFRRTTFTVAWRDARGPTKSASQSTLVVNPSGSLGPRITCFTPVSQTYAPGAPATPAACPAAGAVASTATVAKIVWTTTTAQSLHWEADDGASRGDLVGSPNASGGMTFTTLWDIGDAAAGNGSEVLDGTYVITGQAFDVRDIAGEAKRADVVLNRRAPYAPPVLQGGRNTRLGNRVDFRWGLNRERDVLGYRVIWAGSDGARGGGNDVQVCPSSATASYLSATTQSCADLSPSTTEATSYYIVAIDNAPDGSLRQGAERLLPVSTAVTAPESPTGLAAATTAGGFARLTWTAPQSNAASPASDVAFYRIYRDDSDGDPATVEYSDRHDRVDAASSGLLPTAYTDSQSGTTSHRYWVTAVNSSYNESAPVGPITWTAP